MSADEQEPIVEVSKEQEPIEESSKKLVEEWRNKVDITLWETKGISFNIYNIFDSKVVWKSLSREGRTTIWGIKDWKHYKVSGLDVYEADVKDYAKSILEDFYIYDEIKNYISNENYDCSRIDFINKNFTIEQVLSIGWEKISLMSLNELNEVA